MPRFYFEIITIYYKIRQVKIIIRGELYGR